MRLRRRHSPRAALRRLCAALAVATAATASLAAPPPEPGSPAAWQESIERRLVGLSGLPLAVTAQSDGHARHLVFYAPLAAAWHLTGPGSRVARAGRVKAVTTSRGRFVAVFWETGRITSVQWPEPLPDIVPLAVEPHPLAAFHDRLLTSPVARPVSGLPEGSRFTAVATTGPGGVVERPDNPSRATLWSSLGDHIVITHPDGARTVHGWREVDAALEGGDG